MRKACWRLTPASHLPDGRQGLRLEPQPDPRQGSGHAAAQPSRKQQEGQDPPANVHLSWINKAGRGESPRWGAASTRRSSSHPTGPGLDSQKYHSGPPSPNSHPHCGPGEPHSEPGEEEVFHDGRVWMAFMCLLCNRAPYATQHLQTSVSSIRKRVMGTETTVSPGKALRSGHLAPSHGAR